MSWTHQFLNEVKNILDFIIFSLGLSNFRQGAWFPFDKGQSTKGLTKWETIGMSPIDIFSKFWFGLIDKDPV